MLHVRLTTKDVDFIIIIIKIESIPIIIHEELELHGFAMRQANGYTDVFITNTGNDFMVLASK